ncbi:MAG: tRNA (N6-threonylcarbamoyladenosine(37)-N6)-methyltransferase TrmO [Thermoplasmata archaeon]
MDNEKIEYNAIGVIRTPYKDVKDMPKGPGAGKGVRGIVEIKPEYGLGLKDLDGFSYVMLIFHMHLSKGYSLEVVPPLENEKHGVFATRSPRRPNPIGVTVVKLIRIDGCRVEIEDVDMVDGTPLLDIKPYVPEVEDRDNVKIGWLGSWLGK